MFESLVRDMSDRDEGGDTTTLRLRDGSSHSSVRAATVAWFALRSGRIDLMLLAAPSSASTKRLISVANSVVG